MARGLTKERHIVLAAYPGVSLFELAGPVETFRVASEFGGADGKKVSYKCTIVSSQV